MNIAISYPDALEEINTEGETGVGYLTPVSYTDALTRFPKEVEKILRSLSRSKSREKDSSPESLNWYFCGLLADNGRGGSLPHALGVRTSQASVADRIRGCVLGASKGRWEGRSKTEISPTPPEVISHCEKAESGVRNAPPTSDAEAAEALAKLSRGKGFMMFSFPGKP